MPDSFIFLQWRQFLVILKIMDYLELTLAPCRVDYTLENQIVPIKKNYEPISRLDRF